jgi:cystathionine beta-lyase
MPIDFDCPISRNGTSSVKYDARVVHFGRPDVIPLWVADMDFAAPEAVQKALAERVAHPIYGYTGYPESLYEVLKSWYKTRFDWTIQREWIVLCPGVVASLHAAIFALTKLSDSIIVQPPVYAPFLALSKLTGRNLVLNPLIIKDRRYYFDLEHLEQCVVNGARMLLLCSPHNPVGRVWENQELVDLLKICERYHVTIISDEIHSDLVYPNVLHTPLAKLAENKVRVITAVSPSKTFNIPGLGLSALIVADEGDRAAICKTFETWHVSASNPFSIAAFEAGYREGAEWLEELLKYLADTRRFVRGFLQQNLPRIKMIESEGTYLLWLDCREMNLNDLQLKRFFVEQAGVGLSPGVLFGEQGSGFMRLNIAAPRSIIVQALEQIARVAKDRVTDLEN